MRALNNTLYVTSPDAYLSLDGENVVVQQKQETLGRVPLHNLAGIVTFGYTGASPALMGACAERQIALTFLTAHGRFLARVVGEVHGNVLLRQAQHKANVDPALSAAYARAFILGKVYNTRWMLERAIRDHALRIDLPGMRQVSAHLAQALTALQDAATVDAVRGIEGEAAAQAFSVYDELILQQKEAFFLRQRNRRPPLDNVNALLSFTYTLLAHDTAAALETHGLDPYIGFLHRDRPGRISLALDMMEELRPVLADRFVFSLINRRVVAASDFRKEAGGAIRMQDDARRTVLSAWQARKQEVLTHPYLNEKLEWGLVPYAQAMLLARALRGDLDGYPPFFWK
jgi:CRISPR-associated protein Cas1